MIDFIPLLNKGCKNNPSLTDICVLVLTKLIVEGVVNDIRLELEKIPEQTIKEPKIEITPLLLVYKEKKVLLGLAALITIKSPAIIGVGA